MNDSKMTAACDPHRLLACKIVEQAILDWRKLMRGKPAGPQSNLEEIRNFLQGAWCEELLNSTGVDGEWVLQKLEEEAKAKKKRLVTIDGRTRNICAWCTELGVSNSQVYRMYDKMGRSYVEHYLARVKKEKGL